MKKYQYPVLEMRILILQTLNTRAHQFGHCNFREAATVLESTLLRYNLYLLMHGYSNDPKWILKV